MNRARHSLWLSVVMSLMLSLAAHAQSQHTFEIRDGRVWIDDQLIPTDQLPDPFPIDGLQLQYSFAGEATPMLELRGRVFVLKDGAIREIDDVQGDQRVMVYFRDAVGLAPDEPRQAFLDRLPEQQWTTVTVLNKHAQALKEHKVELERLTNEVGVQTQQELERLRSQAAQAAAVAQELPRLEVQSYLFDVQQQNRELYAQLQKEWQMEQDARQLAWQIRRIQDEQEQQRLQEALRGKLGAMFELKQENRRREIQQLEQELHDLRQRLQHREDLRDRIIEERLHELIGVRPGQPRR